MSRFAVPTLPPLPLPRVPPRCAAAFMTVLALALATTLALPRGTRAPQPLEAVPAGALLGAVAAWTAEATGLPLPDTLPVVARTGRAEMAAIHFGVEAAARGAMTVEALYDAAAGRILLPDDWTGATPEEVSVLVHEMVHHLQAMDGTRHACPAEREALAYEVQDRWLEGFGTDLQTAFDISPLTRFVLTRCGF